MISRTDIEDMTDAQDEASDSLGAALALVKDCTERAVKHGDDRRWSGSDLADSKDEHPSDVDCAIAEILNAALDGRLARPSQAGDERVARLVWAAREAEFDLSEWFECRGELIKAGFNMDGTEGIRDRLRAALAAMDTPKGGGDE